jgi:hypothetical protein
MVKKDKIFLCIRRNYYIRYCIYYRQTFKAPTGYKIDAWFFVLILVIIVIIFQEEIRRLFDQMHFGTILTFQLKKIISKSPSNYNQLKFLSSNLTTGITNNSNYCSLKLCCSIFVYVHQPLSQSKDQYFLQFLTLFSPWNCYTFEASNTLKNITKQSSQHTHFDQ